MKFQDNKQVLVKFGNKDGNGTVTDGEKQTTMAPFRFILLKRNRKT